MKTTTTIKALAAMALMGMFYACDNNDYVENTPELQFTVAKKPEFKVIAGGYTLAEQMNSGTRTAPGNPDVLFFPKSHCPDLFRENFPNQVLPKEECEYVYACIKEDAELIKDGQQPKYEVDKSSFTKSAFYIVNAHSAKDHDAAGGHSSVAGDMHDLAINGQYIKEFNTNTCVSADLILIAHQGTLQDVTYDDSFGQKKQNYTISEWKLFNIPGYGYYVGMDYGSTKYGLDPDGEYSDWVIKIIPAEPKIDPVDENGQVEVNFSVNDEKESGDYVATKLSIHIRALTDAEVFIPVDKKYYCDVDDMDIALSHKEHDVIYKTEPQRIVTRIGESTVTLTVSYEDAGIRVKTDGVDKTVIDFCAGTYADGITFEVWNYFRDINRTQLKAMLDNSTITFLDQNPKLYVNAFAKVGGYSATPIYNKFNENGQLEPYTDSACTQPLDSKYWTRETPDSKDYIFVGQPNPWDCTVVPVEESYQQHKPDTSDKTLPNYNVDYTL